MSRISVNEPNPNPRPKADAVGEARKTRRKTIADARAVRDDMQKETPRYVRAGRIQVQLRPSPSLLRECPSCGHEPWKWQTECPHCGTELP